MGQERRARGAFGETLAARWYRAQGFEVMARNWRPAGGIRGELDLVAQRGALLVFCEVKARASLAYGAPAEAVTAAKQARIRRLAGAFLAEHPGRGRTIRFDVAVVLGARLEVLEGAF